ncbi:hypothetical protein N7466_010206 [Penicillium verhagenii]|uniref:uncharacterized protein n=1 Tax=Penicillium verhagenii TaxID=1562060 RepID=UPI0025452106|nr:uncharacterized protein N7466_010206 [Penicillium verhagenii]KAJ5919263.1 hypothetical protein N7466_010206 [Penicillium verhagenii]
MIQSAVHNISESGSTQSSTLEVRAGYMGLCMSQSDEGRVCSSSAKTLANILKTERTTSVIGNVTTEFTPDPLNLILMAEEFRTKIVFDGLLSVSPAHSFVLRLPEVPLDNVDQLLTILSSYVSVILTFVCFLLLATFPGWHTETNDTGSDIEVKPFPSRPVSQAALGLISISFGFAFISVLWQHINSSSTASMVETLTYGTVSGHIGTAAMVLGWLAVVLIGFVSLGLLIMILSISLLDRLSEE